MALRTRYRRKSPSSPEVQGLFFDKAQVAPAFFNPSHQTGERSTDTAAYSTTTPVVQRQEGAISTQSVQKQAMDDEQPAQKKAMEEEKPVQKQVKEEEKPVQKQAMEEEKPVQKLAKEEEKPPVQKQVKKEEEKPVQKQVKEEEKPVQKQDHQNAQEPVQAKGGAHRPSGISEGQQEQTTGLPDRLKTSIEALSGIAMDDVKVHYNSPKPAQMRALAYTQGTDIYLAPGQEQHLPHEVWHVVQQKQGRVRPTMQTKGVGVNDNSGLEKEATTMGQKAHVM